MSKIDIPDTKLCAAATDLAKETCDPFLLNHCLRSFAFGDAVGRAGGAKYNREILYVACVLHDLGLSASAAVKTRFEVEGADMAKAFLVARGVSDVEQEIVWDAIALHTTPIIPQRKRAEIALCQTGTAIDVGYAPVGAVGADVMEAALTAFPRLGFKVAMITGMCGLIRRNPAAAMSPSIATIGERLIPGFKAPHICDVIGSASFTE